MKLFATFLALIIFTSAAFSGEKPAGVLKKKLIEDYATFAQEIEQLAALSSSEAVMTDWDAKKAQFFKSRLAYKNVELYLTYLDHEFVNDHINGAPLPRIERKAPELFIFDPVGFQTMEEFLDEENTAEFDRLAIQLNHKIKELQRLIPHANLTERMIFEAMREELVRLAAMGITGFDAPTTENALAEAEMVTKSLRNTINAYNAYLSDEDKASISELFKTGERYFEQTNFDTFNRFGFIRDFINPLYKVLLTYQIQLNIPTKDLVLKNEPSVNYRATNIFDTNFLNYAYFSSYTNSGNEEERKALGKLLFFDPIMSHNNERACASCHHGDKAFADGKKTSLAFDGENVLDRNSPGLINAVYNTRFFWDARAATPEEQVEHVLFNPHEFNSSYEEVTAKLAACEDYVNRFDKAYPSIKKINRYTIVASLSAYIQSLRSFNSQFDQSIKEETPVVDPRLVSGFNIFAGKAKCATCHFIPTFAGNVPPLYTHTETEVLAVPDVNDQEKAQLDSDMGRYRNKRPKEKAPFYKHSFKTPTIRNIELTGPYMHNGVFNTLREVVDFYNVGGGHGWGIAPENTTLGADSLHLTDQEIDDLIFFMESLTDTTGMTSQPNQLPVSSDASLNERVIGGRY